MYDPLSEMTCISSTHEWAVAKGARSAAVKRAESMVVIGLVVIMCLLKRIGESESGFEIVVSFCRNSLR